MTQDLETTVAQVRLRIDDVPYFPPRGGLSNVEWLDQVADYRTRIDALADGIARDFGGRIQKCDSGRTTVRMAGLSSSSTGGTLAALRNWVASADRRCRGRISGDAA